MSLLKVSNHVYRPDLLLQQDGKPKKVIIVLNKHGRRYFQRTEVEVIVTALFDVKTPHAQPLYTAHLQQDPSILFLLKQIDQDFKKQILIEQLQDQLGENCMQIYGWSLNSQYALLEKIEGIDFAVARHNKVRKAEKQDFINMNLRSLHQQLSQITSSLFMLVDKIDKYHWVLPDLYPNNVMLCVKTATFKLVDLDELGKFHNRRGRRFALKRCIYILKVFYGVLGYFMKTDPNRFFIASAQQQRVHIKIVSLQLRMKSSGVKWFDVEDSISQ